MSMASEQGGEKKLERSIRLLTDDLARYKTASDRAANAKEVDRYDAINDSRNAEAQLTMTCIVHLPDVLAELADLRARLAAAEGERDKQWADAIDSWFTGRREHPGHVLTPETVKDVISEAFRRGLLFAEQRSTVNFSDVGRFYLDDSPAKPGDAPAPGDGGAGVGVGDAGE